jgi:hypothetical protein
MNTTPANDVATINTIQVGQTRELGCYRAHLYASHLEITDVTCAGKRGKHCIEIAFLTNGKAIACDIFDVIANGGKLGAAIEFAESHGVAVNQRFPRGVDVAPLGSKVELRTGSVYVRAEPGDFFVKDLVDQNNEPCAMTRSRRDGVKLHAWVKGLDTAARASLTFNAVRAAANEMGVSLHQWCAMD